MIICVCFKVFWYLDFNIITVPHSPMCFVLCINKNITLTRYPLTSPHCQRDPHPHSQNVKVPRRGSVWVSSQVTNGRESNAQWQRQWFSMQSYALAGHLAVWEGGTKCPRQCCRSKLVSQGPRDTEPLWQSEDQVQGVFLQVRLNTSHLVFQSTSLTRVHCVWVIGMWWNK